jgi:hypothetical protein
MTKTATVAYATLSYGSDICPHLTHALNVREVLNINGLNEVEVLIMRIGDPIPEVRIPNGVQQRLVNATRAKGSHQWSDAYAKFWVATFSEYDAVVFLDADVLLLKPLHELVELAISVPGTIVTPRAYWLKQPFVTSGSFVISTERPGNATLANSIVSKLKPILSGEDSGFGADMDWLNKQLLAGDLTLVSGWYTLLCGEFYPKDGIYQYFGRELGLSAAEVLQRAHLVHFVASWKPWAEGIHAANGDETTELREIYRRWNGFRDRACMDHVR